jgi:hypothetical protein
MEKNKNILRALRKNFPDLYKHVTNPRKALVFSHCEKVKKEYISLFYKLFKYPTCVPKNRYSLILELYCAPYRLILLDVDSILYELNEILGYSRRKDSINKETTVYLITKNAENLSKLEQMEFDKKIILLTERIEIVDRKGEENVSAENSINSSLEEYIDAG